MGQIVLVILVCLPIFLLLLVKSRNKNAKLPPGPRGLPIIGNIHQFDTSNPTLFLWKLSRQYGPLMSLRLGTRPMVVISSAKYAKEAFKTHDLQFSGRPVLFGLQTLTYNYLGATFAPDYHEWRDMRKRFVTQLLNSNRVDHFRRARVDEISRMTEKISKLGCGDVAAGAADVSSKSVINLSEMAMNLVRNIIFRVSFNKRFEDEGPAAESRFDYLFAETQAMSGMIYFADCFPFMGWLDKLTGMSRRLNKIFKDCDQFYQQLIEEHFDPKRPKFDGQQEDLIDSLLAEMKASGLTLDHIKATIMEIFIGSTETTKVTIEWAMTNLMQNSKAMTKVQEELRCVVKDKGFVDEEDIPKLPYLKAVIKETMRIQPAAQLIPKATTERCNIDGYEIPAKTMVILSVWAIGRDPQVWDKPDEFIPERFIGTNIDMGGQNFEFVPFGSGRRICPGIPIALPTVELALGNLLYKFNWEMPHGMKPDDLDFDVSPGLTQHKKNALKLMATKFI